MDGVLAAVSREEVHIEGSVPAMVPKEETLVTIEKNRDVCSTVTKRLPLSFNSCLVSDSFLCICALSWACPDEGHSLCHTPARLSSE